MSSKMDVYNIVWLLMMWSTHNSNLIQMTNNIVRKLITTMIKYCHFKHIGVKFIFNGNDLENCCTLWIYDVKHLNYSKVLGH